MTKPPSPLGVELRWMRKAAGMTSIQMAPQVRASQPVVSRWETGSRRPSLSQLEGWRLVCIGAIEKRIGMLTPEAAERRVGHLQRLKSPEYVAHLRGLRGEEEDGREPELPNLVPMDRDWLADVLLAAWKARTAARSVGSPREHCEALADAVLRDAGVVV